MHGTAVQAPTAVTALQQQLISSTMQVWSSLAVLVLLIGFTEGTGQKMRHKMQFPKGGNAYALSTGTLPLDLHEFTLCYWVRLHHFNKGSNTVFSYAVPSEDNEIRTFLEGHHDAVYFGFNRKSMYTTKARHHVHLGAWYHTCNVWSSWDGHWEIYINGQPAANGTSIAHGLPVAQGGTIVLGQDQDKPGGGFAPKDSLIGELLDLNMWDETLQPNIIQDLAACLPLSGNVIAWLNSPFALYEGTVIAPTQLCDSFIRTTPNCSNATTSPVNDEAKNDENWGLPCWGTMC